MSPDQIGEPAGNTTAWLRKVGFTTITAGLAYAITALVHTKSVEQLVES